LESKLDAMFLYREHFISLVILSCHLWHERY